MILNKALKLAELGFYVFPLIPEGKTPAIKGFTEAATRDPSQIKIWWGNKKHNVGIITTKFGDGKALLVVDVDNKNGKDGDGEIVKLESEGKDFPKTLTQVTPTGGKHLIYVVDQAVKQGANVLAEGLDIRSHGGYIVGPGSVVEAGVYKFLK
jgi:hypothetical protein